jgi:hypothetical protein
METAKRTLVYFEIKLVIPLCYRFVFLTFIKCDE